jgi:hypothetical protein
LSNEEKRMIMKILKKEWLIWKFWKKGGSREKGGGGNEIHAPCACVFNAIFNNVSVIIVERKVLRYQSGNQKP